MPWSNDAYPIPYTLLCRLNTACKASYIYIYIYIYTLLLSSYLIQNLAICDMQSMTPCVIVQRRDNSTISASRHLLILWRFINVTTIIIIIIIITFINSVLRTHWKVSTLPFSRMAEARLPMQRHYICTLRRRCPRCRWCTVSWPCLPLRCIVCACDTTAKHVTNRRRTTGKRESSVGQWEY